jgi:adenylate cyclase
VVHDQRKLVTVLSADVVSYSRLLGRDESGTLARLRQHRRERLEPALARYGGRLIKLMGDGALVEFASACDGLSAAIEFQQAMTDVETEFPETERIVFRIGLHHRGRPALTYARLRNLVEKQTIFNALPAGARRSDDVKE